MGKIFEHLGKNVQNLKILWKRAASCNYRATFMKKRMHEKARICFSLCLNFPPEFYLEFPWKLHIPPFLGKFFNTVWLTYYIVFLLYFMITWLYVTIHWYSTEIYFKDTLQGRYNQFSRYNNVNDLMKSIWIIKSKRGKWVWVSNYAD